MRAYSTLAFAAFLLSACSSNTGSILKTYQAAFATASPEPSSLMRGRPYLRMTSNGRVLFLAQGAVESSPQEGDVLVWYSGTLEVVKTWQGRLFSTEGLPINWSNLHYSPAIPVALAAQNNVRLVRIYDEMPGYRMNIRQEFYLQKIAPPAHSHLSGISPASLDWYEERPVVLTEEKRRTAARYAVQALPTPQVIYTEQCLSADLCLTWQIWPPAGSLASQSQK